MFVRVSVPSLGVQKALRANPTDLVWTLKKQVCEKVATDMRDALNHGLYMAPSGGKLGKFLDEKRDLGSYQMESNCLLEFIPKRRLNVASNPDAEAAPTPKNQKKFLEDVQKSNVDRVKERGAKGFDPNFWSESGETPLTIAILNNDKDMIMALVENGAYLDFRVGESQQWKTPLHIAATQNKALAVQTLLSYGAWVNSPDIMGLTPLYYTASLGYAECVERLLIAKADTEVFDESGKGPLHQACMNNHESVVALLVDFGASMSAVNIAGNTPLHVAAARNAVECLRWLLMRGADRDRGNKSGQTALQVAMLSGSTEAADVIKAFTPEMIVPPPPRYEELLEAKKSPLTTSPSAKNLNSATGLALQHSSNLSSSLSTFPASTTSPSSSSAPAFAHAAHHLRSFSEQYRSSGEISAAVAAAAAIAGFGNAAAAQGLGSSPSLNGNATSPTAGATNATGANSGANLPSYFPSSNYYEPGAPVAVGGRGVVHSASSAHFRSISEYGVASTGGSNPSRRLSHLANSNASGSLGSGNLGGSGALGKKSALRPSSESLEPESLQEGNAGAGISNSGLRPSSSMQSISQVTFADGTGGFVRRTVKRQAVVGAGKEAAASPKSGMVIPGPPPGPRPADVPPPPPRIRPSSLDGKGKNSSATSPASATSTSPGGITPTKQVRLSVTQPEGVTFNAGFLGNSESDDAIDGATGTEAPTPKTPGEKEVTFAMDVASDKSSIHEESDTVSGGSNPSAALADAQTLLQQIRSSLNGAPSRASPRDGETAASGATGTPSYTATPPNAGLSRSTSKVGNMSAETRTDSVGVERDLDALSQRLNYLESTLNQALSRALKAEAENGQLRREVEELRVGTEKKEVSV
ncbi:hypothetical protein HDU96_000629 [Phlyctochytrium bullatum]|nr:hypothetical protein HDU96_000629 [Phlyctochytrium bullatum]